jgi:hypothetical protein
MSTKTGSRLKPARGPSKPRSKKSAAGSRPKAPKKVRKDIPQKVLLYAARTIAPPAISDEVPDEMPFIPEGE